MCLDVRRRLIAEGERTSEKGVMRESKGSSSLGWVTTTVCAAIPPTLLHCGPIYLVALVDAAADTDTDATTDTDADATTDTDADTTADADADAVKGAVKGAGANADAGRTRTQRSRSRRSFTLGRERSVTHQ